ncbi:MAG: hypothetical protein JXR96_28295 [Deltaproteobacteria bacterium]|nr:hypothetical protein [Deltaproteobacteria bacterium]
MSRSAVWVFGLVFFAGCAGSEGPPPFLHGEFYQQLRDHAESFLLIDGDWKEDMDDGLFYGLAYYARAGESEDDEAFRARAQEAYQRDVRLVQEADLLTGDMNQAFMAALGLVEYMDATGDRGHLADLDGMIEDVNELVSTLGHYLPPEAMPGYAMETYGPTSINGLMSLLSLQRAFVLGGADAETLTAFSNEVAKKIGERSWNGASYDFGAGREGLFLYPNITMIILHARLYQLTAGPEHLERALTTYQGMQPLKVTIESGWAGPGRYRSPYSAEYMGAQSDDYSTLSSQNYLMLALMLLYQVTGETAFLEEMDSVLDFLEGYLVGEACYSDVDLPGACDEPCPDGLACLKGECFEDACHQGVLHHWMDGRLAVPADPEYFCSGCNLQLLYLMWYRQEMIQ